MIPVKLIIIVGLVCLFVGVTFFRMYLRTDLKGYLLISLGAVIGLIGGIISYLGNLIMSNKTMVDVIGETIMIIGIILSSSGPIILCTLESGAAQSALSGHSIFDIALGNISSLEKKKYPPTLKRRSGIIVGFLIIILGIARCWYEYPTESYAGIFTIAVGLVIFVISIVALKEKKGI
jgi:hypothetical protein